MNQTKSDEVFERVDSDEGDIFEYSLGEITRHVPWFLRRDADKPEKPGDCYAVYAMCRNKDGTQKCEVLSISEVNGIQRRSKSGSSGPWKTDWSEMAKKTAFRRLSKWLVLSPEFRDAIAEDEDREIIETTAERSDPIKIAELIGDHFDSQASAEDEQTEQPPASKLTECLDILKRENIECVDSDPEGTRFKFRLGKGDTLTLGDGVDGNGSVDTLEADSPEQVANVIAASRPKKR